ncbi:hypothetical protein IE077_001404 [Cardiosporidium cionae]|uniref:Sugar phosphate transporter domain-containing protein n=1 Tax=Cardiosporidium cionae TaxID=476202 RepID=A0ABQ7JD34_9APIC|nr:hypothetical protein IE077_001404 [Cardiosporidium cionae]|eukprot:KAF8821896.1 hypothetical protein IE077_001404 [Cardiosporidium cionae]
MLANNDKDEEKDTMLLLPRTQDFVKDDSPQPSMLQTVSVVCGTYVILSLSIVFLNWSMFTSTFQYPIFITWCQQILGLCLYWSVYFSGKRGVSAFSKMKIVKLNRKSMEKLLPVAFSFIAMVVFANLALKYARISTYQTARCLTIFFTISFSYIFLGQTFRKRILLACALQAFGFLIGSLDVSTLKPLGSFFGCMSSIAQGIYNVSVKRALPETNNDTFALFAFNVTFSSVALLPLVFLFGEGAAFTDIPLDITEARFWQVWPAIILSGTLATSLNLVSYMVIKVTSPVTFNIVGVLKSCFQTMVGLTLFGDPLTLKSFTGVVFTMIGSGWYGMLRLQENSTNKAAHLENVEKNSESIKSASPTELRNV